MSATETAEAPQRSSPVCHISGVQVGPMFEQDKGHVPTMNELAYLHNQPEHPARQVVQGYCSKGCGAMFQVMKFFESVTGCDECVAKAIEDSRIERCRKHWEDACPERYRKTDLKHEHFPKAQHELTKDWVYLDEPTGPDDKRSEQARWQLRRSLFFFGPSGSGKTRLAFVLLKRAMLYGGKNIGVMFDDDLNAAKSNRERALAVKEWSRFDVLLLDDALMTGAQDEATTSFLKSLLEKIMAREKHVIITSQISRAEYEEQLRKFDSSTRKTTAADEQRAIALWRRIKEMCGDAIEFHNAPGAVAPAAAPAGKPADADLPF